MIEQLYGACFYEEYFEDGESILSGILYGKLANDFELNQSDRYVNTYIGVTKILGVDMSEPPEDYTTKQDVMEKIFKLVKSCFSKIFLSSSTLFWNNLSFSSLS